VIFTSKNVAEIGLTWPKIEFFDFFEKVSFFTDFTDVSNVFHDLKNLRIAKKKFENLSILANFGQF
jgi:hypothetical protein